MFAANLKTAKWQDTPWKTGVHVRWYLFTACIICTLYIYTFILNYIHIYNICIYICILYMSV